jgi:4-amino-4-deoxy-L-arabinose transferase-like glycosyltransferase
MESPAAIRRTRRPAWSVVFGEPVTGRLALLVLFAAAVLALSGIGRSLPLESHESYVARTATEMVRRGDYVVPHFNDELRLQKPPLSYWLVIAAHRVISADPTAPVTEFEARLPSALAALALVLITMLTAASVFGDARAAVLAGALAVTSRGVVAYSHSARPEMVYAACCAAMLLGFLTLLDLREDSRWQDRFGIGILTWTAAGLALLTKGPFLPAFILLGVAISLLCMSGTRGKTISMLQLWTGLVVVLVVAGPWYGSMLTMDGVAEFWRHEMFDRTGGAGAWWQPLTLYYVRKTPNLFVPWWVLIPPALVLHRHGTPEVRRRLGMLWGAILSPMILLSFSRGSTWYYMLPLLPAMCVLLAGACLRILDRWAATEQRRWWVRFLTSAYAVTASVAAILVGLALFLSERGAHLAPMTRWTWAAACVMTVVFMLLAVNWSRRDIRRSMGWTVASMYLLMLSASATGLAWRVDERIADRDFARRVAEIAGTERALLSVRCEVARFVHYADRTFERLRYPELAAHLQDDPNALVLTRRRVYERGEIAGVILAEQSPDAVEHPCVLLAAAVVPEG